MIIGVDVDEILADFLGPLIAYHNETYGTALKREDFVSYHFNTVWGGTRDEAIRKVHGFFETPHFASIQPLDGCAEAITALKDHHQLYAITSRQTVIAQQTKDWIAKHFPGAFKEVYVTNNWGLSGPSRLKKDVCKELGVELFIDDALENILSCAAEGIECLLLDYPWNREELPKNVTRVHSWKEMLDEIHQRAS